MTGKAGAPARVPRRGQARALSPRQLMALPGYAGVHAGGPGGAGAVRADVPAAVMPAGDGLSVCTSGGESGPRLEEHEYGNLGSML